MTLQDFINALADVQKIAPEAEVVVTTALGDVESILHAVQVTLPGAGSTDAPKVNLIHQPAPPAPAPAPVDPATGQPAP